MVKWATFFVFTFVLLTIIMAVLDGGGGIVSTTLTTAVTKTATTLSVNSTANFLAADVSHPAFLLVGEQEIVSYTSKTATSITGVSRGIADPQTQRSTKASAHLVGTPVRTLAVGALDSFMGYNITTSGATFGALDAVTFGFRMFIDLPKFLMWNYSIFQGEWIVARYILMSLSAGFLFGIGLAMLTLAQSLW